MPIHPKTVHISQFKGINNVLDAESTPPEYLKKADNVNIDKLGGIKKRKGYTLEDSGLYTSLWSSETTLGMYAVKNGTLLRKYADGYSTIIKSGITSDTLSFEEIDGKIYFSSISTNGIIDFDGLRDWGLPPVNMGVTLTQTVGEMPAGTYMVGFTTVTSDGRESGLTTTSTITLSSTGGITLTLPVYTNTNIVYCRVYCSTTDGNTLYFSKIGTPGETIKITDSRNLISPLRMFGLYNPPLGHIIKYYRGRMYVAQDNILWYSEPYQYEHFKIDSNYIEFPSKIREVMPVEDGIWIGSDKLYYLSGEDALTFKRTTKEEVKIVEGTGHKLSGSYVHIDNTPIGYKWLVTSNLGIFILFNQGMTINLSAQNINLKAADSGMATFLKTEGMNQYLSILKTNQNPNNSVVGDLVETTIVRNGIIIT